MNLMASMCRSIGIPIRFVTGYSLPIDKKYRHSFVSKNTLLKSKNTIKNYTFPMVDGHSIWLEYYSPRLGWLPIHMNRQSFYFFHHLPIYIKELTFADLKNLMKSFINNNSLLGYQILKNQQSWNFKWKKIFTNKINNFNHKAGQIKNTTSLTDSDKIIQIFSPFKNLYPDELSYEKNY